MQSDCNFPLHPYSASSQILFFHFAPIVKPVEVVCQKHNEAYGDGKIGDVLKACQHPQKDQHQVVCGVGQGVVGGTAEGEVHGDKAGGNGQGAGGKVCGVEKC